MKQRCKSRYLTLMTFYKFKIGDKIKNILTKEIGIISEITKYGGYIINYSDKSGIKFRKSHEKNLILINNHEVKNEKR